MKAILEFNLPEKKEFKTATKAADMSLVLFEFSQFLREKLNTGIFPIQRKPSMKLL